jgi:hypothetical protein
MRSPLLHRDGRSPGADLGGGGAVVRVRPARSIVSLVAVRCASWNASRNVRWDALRLLHPARPGTEAFHHCPGRKPLFLAVKRPARPYKSAIETRFT